MFCFFFISACEKTTLNKPFTPAETNEPILPRSDCNQCPGDDECCCTVTLENNDNYAYLNLCGTSDGIGLCSGSDECGSTFSGGFQQIDLSYPSHRGQVFCMGESSPFWIYNYHSTDVANFQLTCQNDHTAPQILHVQMQPGDKLYLETNASCEITTCVP